MSLLNAEHRFLCGASRELIATNPFLPRWQDQVREILGDQYVQKSSHWADESPGGVADPNVVKLRDRCGRAAREILARLKTHANASESELSLYESLVLFYLYHEYRADLTRTIQSLTRSTGRRPVDWYPRFEAQATELLNPSGRRLPHGLDPGHLLAFCFQMRRAFQHIFDHLVGRSESAVRLRAAAWQSIFTHDVWRYARSLYSRMNRIPTLITGPSGTGKELVARAIGLSGYIPFDVQSAAFAENFGDLFYSVNLSSLPHSLIESELFGHRKGAFTGALRDQVGWFESCRPLGAILLDEIGEIEPWIQVKLLRVLHTGTFQRIGETRVREFHGKVICASNRDLHREMREGRFRADLYYRICADQVATSSLEEQVSGSREELRHLVSFIARREGGEDAEALTEDVMVFIETHLGLDYSWPGNFRELEQCVRNVLVHNEYRPLSGADPQGLLDSLSSDFLSAKLPVEQVIRRYVTLVYAREKSYEAAAKVLGMDRRTVKAKVDPSLLDRVFSRLPPQTPGSHRHP